MSIHSVFHQQDPMVMLLSKVLEKEGVVKIFTGKNDPGCKLKELEKHYRQWFIEFLGNADISLLSPKRKDNAYVALYAYVIPAPI